MGNDTREQIKKKVDQLAQEAVSFLQQMVRINSENPPGNNPELAEYLAEQLKVWGMLVDVHNPPQELLTQLGLPGPRLSVVAKLKESGSPALILCPHLDTVPAGDARLWKDDPFSGQIRDGRVYGRGALDSKGRIAAYVTAMRAIKELDLDLRGNIILAATADEEIGGESGVGYLVKHGILKGDYCIAEGMSDFLCYALNGVIHMEVSTKGKSCHPLDPSKGVNAIYKMAPLIVAVERYHEGLTRRGCTVKGIKFPSCSLGTIKGGIKTNVVPDHCVVTIDRRITPDEKLDDVRKELAQLLEQASPGTYYAREIMSGSSYKTDPKSKLVRIVNDNVKEITGKRVAVKGLGGSSDARFFANELGIPTINFGPGRLREGKLHEPNENLRISDLISVAKVCALSALDLDPRDPR